MQSIYAERFPDHAVQYEIDQERLAKEATFIAQVRFILENAGRSIEAMPTSSGFNRWFASTPSNFALDWLAALVPIEREAMLAAGATPSFAWVSMSCQQLHTLSEKALADFRFPAHPAPAPQPSAPIAHCIRCHSPHALAPGAPVIPFDDTMRLRALFAQKPELVERIRTRIRSPGPQQMPPYGLLTEPEILAFEAFLDAVR